MMEDTKDGGNIGQDVEDRVRAPPHSNSVVGESSSPLSQHHGSSEMCGQEERGGWDRGDATRRRGRCPSGTPEGSSAPPKGQQQRLLRSDSDRAILGRVDYKAVKRDLR